MNETTIEIKASELAALVKPVMPFVADEMYLAINAVRVTTQGPYVIAQATDRFRAGIQRIKPELTPMKGFEALIGVSELRRILSIFKTTRVADSMLALTVTGEADDRRLKVTQSGGFGFIDAHMTFSLQRGDFPKIDKLLTNAVEDSTDPAAAVALNPHYLADFRHAAPRNEPIIMHAANPGKPVIITAGEDFIGLIMPVRSDTAADTTRHIKPWVDFLSEATPKPKAKAA